MCEERKFIALAICIDSAGRVLVARRAGRADFSGLWEFPGGKINPGESPQAAAVRELMEETAVSARPTGSFPPFDWDYPHARLRFFPILCRPDADSLPEPASEMQWLMPQELKSLDFPPANAGLIEQLAARAGREA